MIVLILNITTSIWNIWN